MIMGLEKLIELAGKIENEELRKKTIEILKDIKLTHPEFQSYERENPENVRTPFIVNDTVGIRELIIHTTVVTEACIKIAELIEKRLGVKVDKDILIAGALLHDIMKVYEFKNGKPTGILLDHSALALAELYKRDFPQEVLHLVISHAAPSTNPPRTLEAVILHYVDSLFALVEFGISQSLKKEEEKEKK
jgi:7,8-dihydroneopterin 2',3'-cyclic phosphate phosphodiesterase